MYFREQHNDIWILFQDIFMLQKVMDHLYLHNAKTKSLQEVLSHFQFDNKYLHKLLNKSNNINTYIPTII